MRLLFLVLTSIFLSACSIQNMVEKSAPESVLSDHTAHIDSLLNKDQSRIVSAFDLDVEQEAVQEQLSGMLNEVPGGKEIRRDYVGLESSTSFGTGDGKSRNISLSTEVQTTEGFMMVIGQYSLDEKTGECCAITNLNVQKFDTSPMRKTWETFAKIGKFAALFFSGLIALILFLVFRANKKRRAEREAGNA